MNDDKTLEECTIAALLNLNDNKSIQQLLPKFSSPLKDNFENKDLWLRFGLTLNLIDENATKQSHNSALQAFQECLRIEPSDPLPALLAAKLMFKDWSDHERGLKFTDEAIKRCKRLLSEGKGVGINELLSKSYLLASIIHSHIYEHQPESIKKFETSHLIKSQQLINLARKQCVGDHLIYFQEAFLHARQKSYKLAIDCLRKAIELNPYHVPSFQFMILSLSALKLYNEALTLCESALVEFEDNLLLLYIKCNLEQCLVETKGYKFALNTAQHILKCIRKSRLVNNSVQQTITRSKSPSDTNKQSSQHSSITNGTNQHSIVTTTQANITPQEQQKTFINLFADEKSPDRDEIIREESTIWLLVAEIFIKIGSLSDAELCVDEASMDTNGALSNDILFLRGLISFEKNNLIEAKSFLQSCLALNPRHSRALQQVGHVYHKLGEHSIAEKFLQDSLDLDVDCHKTWHYLCQVYIETKQFDKAKECEKKAAKLEESMPIIPLSSSYLRAISRV